MILGYQAFDPDIRIAGVILNQLGGARHERKLRAVIEHYTDVPVIGAVHHDDRLAIIERHLGLMPSNEASGAHTKIDVIASAIENQVDLDRLMTIAASAPTLSAPVSQGAPLSWASANAPGFALPPASMQSSPASETGDLHEPPVRIGVAHDAAFAFYYPGDLDALRQHGAELVYFDTLKDPHLPEVDALFIGGGFPEVHMQALEANRSLRAEIRQVIESDCRSMRNAAGSCTSAAVSAGKALNVKWSAPYLATL